MALRAIWQLMDWDVTNRIVYGPKRSRGQSTIVWVTHRYINCHLSRSAMNYLLYYTQCLQNCQTTFFLLLYIYDQQNEFDKIRKKTIYWLDPVNILKYWPAVLTKSNRENKNVKNNIYQIVHGTKGHMAVYELGCHPQNIIWTVGKLRSIY